ncbi:MAG: hypothetical protein SGBAC_006108 [Bacillariaceae sp.]
MGNERLPDTNPQVRTTGSFARREQLQKSSSDRSLGSIDSIPTTPPRVLSPGGGRDVVEVVVTSQLKDLFENLPKPPNTTLDQSSAVGNNSASFLPREGGLKKIPSDRSFRSHDSSLSFSSEDEQDTQDEVSGQLNDGPLLNTSSQPSFARREGLSKVTSERSLGSVDAMPARPSRLLSPTEEKGVVQVSSVPKDLSVQLPHREKAIGFPHSKSTPSFTRRDRLAKVSSERSLRSVDSMPARPSRFLSPNQEKGAVQVSSELKDSLVNLSLQEKGLGLFKSRSTVSFTRRPRASSMGSIDEKPALPSRRPSPIGKKGAINVPRQVIEIWPPSKREDAFSSAKNIVQTPLEPSESATVVGDTDLRDSILARIPDHVKDLLSMDQWYRILEPIKARDDSTTADISDCTEEIDHSEKTEEPERTRGALQPTEDEEELQDSDKSERSTTTFARARACDALYCTEKETKRKEVGEDRESAPPVTSVTTSTEGNKKKHRISRSPGVVKEKKKVSFGNAQIRWHERILVVHPCTSSGPSVGIGWDFDESEETIDFDHETHAGELRLGRHEREDMINDLGYSTRDVAYAVRESLKIKNERRRTINNLSVNVMNVEKVEYMAEKCNRKIRKLQKRFFVGRK